MTSLLGTCNCGAVRVDIADRTGVDEAGIVICHCTTCRKFFGAIAGYFLIASRAGTTITGDTRTWVTKGPASGLDKTFHVCTVCGSSLLCDSEVAAEQVFVCAGLFEPGSLPAPKLEMWTDRMETWEALHDSVKVLATQ